MLIRISFQNLVLAFFLVLLLASCREQSGKIRKKPNILLIVADDQGWGDVGAHGNEIIHTPTLDSLSAISARFDRFYVSPVCAPTRASLLTGRYHLNTGVSWVTKRMEVMREREVTVAELLKTQGYRTGVFGKWHNGSQYPHDPTGQGFDIFFGFTEGHLNNYFDTQLIRNRHYEPTQGYVADLITNEAIDFVSKDDPFFCYLAFNTPHSPFQVPDAYFNKYKAKGLDDRTAAIYGMVENMDDNINRILKVLSDRGKSRETIVIFLSDNGPNGVRYNGNLKGIKAQVDEGGVTVPFLIHYPDGGIQNKTIAREYFGAHIDVLPTLAELAGIDLPDTLDIHGRSLVPLLNEDNPAWEDRNFFTHQVIREFDTIPGAVRTGQYTLTIKNTGTELYDILKDPFQKQNIASQYPDIVDTYLSTYHSWFLKATEKGISPELIQIGHGQIDEVILPAQECRLFGSVSYQGDGWANDWLINWKVPSDSAVWTVNAIAQQHYQLIVSGSAFMPADFKLFIDNKAYPITISPAEAPVISNRDRYPRSEVEERDWKEIGSINIDINKGIHEIKLMPNHVTGDIAIKAIHLKKI
jgi:arylsulfatase A-like enzyme